MVDSFLFMLVLSRALRSFLKGSEHARQQVDNFGVFLIGDEKLALRFLEP